VGSAWNLRSKEFICKKGKGMVNMLKKLFIMLLILNIISINNIYCQDNIKIIKVTYSIDAKTIKFSLENITVYQGDIIE